jgi:hypothetical protein
MSSWVIVGPHARPRSRFELLTSFVLIPVMGLAIETLFRFSGFSFVWLLPLNFFLYHVYAHKLTRGSVKSGIVVAATAFLIEQVFALMLGMNNLFFLFLHT